MPKEKIVVGLSGGVDSAVSAFLLKEQGYDVVGVLMKNWDDDDDSEYCSTRQDWLDAASVADSLGIDIEAVNFAAEYKDRVFQYFLAEYAAGRTPNPDILCNTEIKFKAFLDYAASLGASRIATGHYAGVRQNGAWFELLRGQDVTKDQSYFLHRLNQAQLSKAIFPLHAVEKTKVREIAQKIGLHNAAKKDSTGICFIGERPFRDFLNRYLPTKPGAMLNDQGQEIGQHIGLSFYTLGQRKGIGVGGTKTGNGGAWYVAQKNIADNTLTIVQEHDHPLLSSNKVVCEPLHWIATPRENGAALSAKTRYRQQDAACTIEGNTLHFTAPQWAVTPGQSAVLYDGEVCLGGAVIA